MQMSKYVHISGNIITCLVLDSLVSLWNQIWTTHLPLGQEPLANIILIHENKRRLSLFSSGDHPSWTQILVLSIMIGMTSSLFAANNVGENEVYSLDTVQFKRFHKKYNSCYFSPSTVCIISSLYTNGTTKCMSSTYKHFCLWTEPLHVIQ